MERYANGKIYTIRSPHMDKYYIGSTCLPLSKRFYKHKVDLKCYELNKGAYISSFCVLQAGDAYIELLEDYPCISKAQLERREGELQRDRKDEIVNWHIAGRTLTEYQQDNKEVLKQRWKSYHEANKEQLIQKKKAFRQANKEQISQYEKQYREANKEAIKQRWKRYYEANKVRLLQKQTQKITCECGCVINNRYLKQHQKTKKHLQWESGKTIGTNNSDEHPSTD